jgi:hyperosmotically inducible protein
MSMPRFLKAIALAATSLALVACAGDPTPPATAQYTDDAAITQGVQAAVIGVPGVHADQVEVMTKDGVVTLSGAASSELAALNAVQAARQVVGVKKVNYDIRVAQP